MSGDQSMYDDDNNNKDDGSVWTSYSDLFTTVAVIFLVMFVFALIKAGVSKMQQVVAKREHEQELKAVVTKKNKIETQEKIQKVNDTLTNISNYEDLIDQKMKDMNKFVNSLQENKKVLNELIKDQQRKENQLAKASQVIKKQEEEIIQKVTINEELSQKLAKEKEFVQQKIVETKQLNQDIQNKEKVIAEKVEALKVLNKEQQELENNFQESLKSIENLKVVKKEKQKQIKDLSQNLAAITQTRSIEIANYNKKIQENFNEIKQLKELVNNNDQTIEQNLKDIAKKEQVIANNQKLIQEQDGELKRKKELMDKQIAEINRLSSTSQDQKKNIEKLQVSLANKVSELAQNKTQNEQMQKLAAKQKEKIDFLDQQLNLETLKFRKTAQELDQTQDQLGKVIADLTKTRGLKAQAEKRASELSENKVKLEGMLAQVQKRADNLDTQLQSKDRDYKILSANHENLKKIKDNLEKENLSQVTEMGKLNGKVAKLSADNNFLQQQLSNKALDIKTLKTSLSNVKGANQKLEKENRDLQTQNGQIQAQMNQVAGENSYLSKKNDLLEKQNTDNSRKIASISSELANEKQNAGALQRQIKDLESNYKNQIAQMNNEHANQMAQLKGQQASEVNQLKNQYDQKLAALKNELNNQMKSNPVQEAKIAELNNKNQQISKTLNTCETDLNFRKKEVATLENKFKDKFKNLDQNQKLLADYKNQTKELSDRNKNLKESLNDFANKVANVKGKLRSNIAKDLAQAFKAANLNVLVDNKTGNVVLQMDKNFRFKKNSYYLNKKAKETLKKIIPIYSKVLFGNKEIKNKISSFNVVGHASPSFRGKFVSPEDHNSKAYSYNMRLSAQRASSITNYIFSNSIGEYDHKQKLQLFTKAIGQGYIKPVAAPMKLNRKPASTGACGPYDCYSSQRVEISFTLKDDVNSINELIEMTKDIK